MIVDDEPNIRSGLMKLIEWEVYGIEIVGEAEDGIKAYMGIKSLRPDIVLLDISMPNMNGIELMELCERLEYKPRFIILSGYNDFEYVRKALQSGAVNYMLKPVDQDELVQTVMSTVRLLDEASSSSRQFQEIMQSLRNDVLVRVLNNRIDSLELREKCHFTKLSFRCNHMRIGLLQARTKDLSASGSASQKWLDFSDIEICEKICNERCECYAAIDNTDTLTLIFKDNSDQFDTSDFERLLEKCRQAVAEHLNTGIFTSLSENIDSLSELPKSYKTCRQDFERQQIMESFFKEDSLAKLEQTSPSDIDYTVFLQALENCDTEQIRSFIHMYLADILATAGIDHIENSKYYLIEFILYTLQKMESSLLIGGDIGHEKRAVFEIIRQSDSITVLEEKLIEYFILLANQLKESTGSHYSSMTQSVLNYVVNNYSDSNLSLKTLAGQMDVNAAYLGRQFAMETNEYFSDYLNRIRISHALRLLSTTTQKTAVIAESVGFSNISYFFTIFKKVTGGRPGDYRKTTSKGENHE